MGNVLESKGVSFAYEKQNILTDVTFSVGEGEYVALTGENGSGKSTLLQVLLGELSPATGETTLFETPVSHFKEWGKLGYLPQNGITQVLGFPANVLEIVAANLYSEIGPFRFPGKKHYTKAQNALELVELGDLGKRMPNQLSGGQLQRVLLAKALVSSPKLLLLDEPTTAMDSQSTELFYEKIEELHQQGLSIFMITHSPEQVEGQVDRMLHLKAGHLTVISQQGVGA